MLFRSNTEATDLDEFFQLFGIKRDPQSIYNGSNFTQLSAAQINEYKSADSKFRVAISKFLQALQRGGTVDGIRLMAEAASGYPVQIIEPWQNAIDEARLSTINETVILILADSSVSDEQQSQIKTKVIDSLEMIRPAGALFTVDITSSSSDNELNPDYAAADSFMFLSDGNNQYVELLSQEKEIEMNSFIVEANPFEVDNRYSTLVGSLNAEGDLDTSIVVNETLNPQAPVFMALLSDGESFEIVLVHNRFAFDQNNQTLFVYEVNRAQLGSTQINWNEKSSVTIQINLNKKIGRAHV